MNKSHTPGPWFLGPVTDGYQRIISRGLVIADVPGGKGKRILSPNGRLIAGAPELLEALEKVSEKAGEISTCLFCDSECNEDSPHEEGCPMEMIFSAIAKAKGVNSESSQSL